MQEWWGEVTIGQVVFGLIAIALFFIGMNSIVDHESDAKNRDKEEDNTNHESNNAFTIVCFLVEIISILIVIINPYDTPTIKEILNPDDSIVNESVTDSNDADIADEDISSDDAYQTNSITNDGAFIEYPLESFPETLTEGIVEFLPSALDIEGNEHKNVLYMEGGSVVSTLIIHTDRKYSRISFYYNAIYCMDPNAMERLRVYIDNKDYGYNEIAAIPKVNSSGDVEYDIAGSTEVRIEFIGSNSTVDSPCAVILSHLMLG